MAVATQSQSKKNFLVRFFTLDTSGGKGTGRKLPLWRQLLLQVLCLLLLLEVMFPLMYVITMSLSSKSERPTTLRLIPNEFSLVAFKQVLDKPTANPVTFLVLLRNSTLLSFGVGALALLIAVTAAYAFSRFNFKMRQVLMILVFIPLLMPAVGLTTPLFLLFNSVKFLNCGANVMALTPFTSCAAGETGKVLFNLRDSLLGVGIAMISSALPFAVWNLKGYLDTIP
jgi:arabinogalactan oligomer/maltooligosaccharide transport system permease protein